MRIKLFTILLSFFIINQLYGQNGFVRGKVFDAATGEFLPGVTIYCEGTTWGAITDLDGKFNLEVPAGIYEIRISFISYETVHIKDVEVKAGEASLIDDLGLQEATISLSEVTITAQAIRNTENALVAIKRKSPNLLDGISAVTLKKIGDSDAASSIKRVPGVSVEGGKYVFVRGLGDRYTKTILNGADVPGLDPDRNSLQMDLFPTNIIDNIIVHKSFSADLPADFTGGVIDIEIKDFPEKKMGGLSFSGGYNPNFHFSNEYLTYEGGNTDFLGFDDGTREIPATENIPEFAHAIGNLDKRDRYIDVLNSFNPVMSTIEKNSLMDFSFGASFGDQKKKDKVTVGYNLSISYKNNKEFFKNAEDGRYGLGDKDKYEMEVREHQIGNYGVNNTFLSGLAGYAIKTMHSKYRVYLLHLQNGESKAGVFNFTGSDQGSEFTSVQHNLDYSQRSLTNLLIDGKYSNPDSKWDFEWKISPTLSKLYDPDIRFTRYEDRDGTPTIGTEVGFPERIWRDLKEINVAGLTHLKRDYLFRGRKSVLKFGVASTYKKRIFSINKFLLNIRGGDGELPLDGNPDELFSAELLWPYNGNVNYGTSYEKDFSKSNRFNASVYYFAGYALTEINFFSNFKTTTGLRIEKFIQFYSGQNQQGTKVLDNDKVLNEIGFFPSINLVYNISKKQNLRASFSKTIARPSVKELSYAEIYDPISGRTFLGGLHNDLNNQGNSDPSDDIVYWDGNLISTDIYNYDIRWELYGQNSQMISFSGFYKKFNNPIELVQSSVQVGAFQPRNVGNGEVLGAETEFRLGLGGLTEFLDNFKITSNVTITKSRIKLSNTEYNSRIDNARTGQTIDEYRDMAGQAPIIINSGITYGGSNSGFLSGFEAGLYYNVQGQTLQYVGIVDRPDIYSKPFHGLNFNSNLVLSKNNKLKAGLKIENLLNDKKETVFKSFKATDKLFSSLESGMSFKLSLSYTFF